MDDEEIVVGERVKEVEQSSRGTKVVKKVPCGKDNCSSCPHGPHVYYYRREDDTVVYE